MKKVISYLSLVLVAAGLSACDIKAKSGGNAAPPPAPKPFADEVTGPALDGTWKSGCEKDNWSDAYVSFDVVINGRNISRTETKFTDTLCTVKTTSLERKGAFRFVKNHGRDIYEVEYKFEMPNGSYYTGDNIRRAGAKMWISDRYIGANVDPQIQLNFVNPTPQ